MRADVRTQAATGFRSKATNRQNDPTDSQSDWDAYHYGADIEIPALKPNRSRASPQDEKRMDVQNVGACAPHRFVLNAPHRTLLSTGWPRGGVVTQRTANPCTRVRFSARPPNFLNQNQIITPDGALYAKHLVLHPGVITRQQSPDQIASLAAHKKTARRRLSLQAHTGAYFLPPAGRDLLPRLLFAPVVLAS